MLFSLNEPTIVNFSFWESSTTLHFDLILRSIPIMRKLFLLFTIASALFSSCSTSDESEVTKGLTLFQKIVQDSTHHFHGIDLGQTINEVRLTEKTKVKDEQDDYLFYEVPIDATTNYTFAYSFDDEGLYEIQVDVFLKSKEEALELFTDFKRDYIKKYGPMNEKDTGYAFWQIVLLPDSNEAEISVIEESDEFDQGKLSITFYDYSY